MIREGKQTIDNYYPISLWLSALYLLLYFLNQPVGAHTELSTLGLNTAMRVLLVVHKSLLINVDRGKIVLFRRMSWLDLFR